MKSLLIVNIIAGRCGKSTRLPSGPFPVLRSSVTAFAAWFISASYCSRSFVVILHGSNTPQMIKKLLYINEKIMINIHTRIAIISWTPGEPLCSKCCKHFFPKALLRCLIAEYFSWQGVGPALYSGNVFHWVILDFLPFGKKSTE